MKRTHTIFFFVFLGLPVLGVVTWYCVSFVPHVSELHAIEEQSREVTSSAPSSLYKIIATSETTQSMRSWVTRQAYGKLSAKHRPVKMLSWHLNNMLWFYASYVHFSDKQIFFLWVYYAPYESGTGLNNAAMHYFGKYLSSLSERQLAALVMATRSPTRFRPGTERSERAIQKVLEKMQGS